MSLIEFKDLPDTTTPLTAENLNNNFNYLDDKIPNILNASSQSTTDAYSCDFINDNIINDFYFQNNEIFTVDEWYSGGFLTNGGLTIRFTIPLPKHKGNTTNVSITAGRLYVYSINGKIEDNLSLPNSKVEVKYYRDGYITIFCTNSTAYSTTNQTPVGIHIDNLKLQFS